MEGCNMKDLTQKSIGGHILQMAIPITAGMFFQTLYFLIDLYFVARLGDASLAGVGAAGNVSFLVFALTQVLGVGTVALISHAAGRKDRVDATLVFNQSLALSATCALITLVVGYAVAAPYMRTLGADAATEEAGIRYLYWFLPSLALQFAMVVMGSALRGTGIVQPTIIVQVLTVIVNVILAPILIAVGVVLLAVYFHRLEKYVSFDPSAWRPRLATWARVLRVGLPAGGEFALMFVFMGVMYWIIRRFGQDAQAGFGVGQRILQSMFLPAMAVSFATAPIVGQNFAAGKFERVREAFRVATWSGVVIMIGLTVLCKWRAEWVVHAFTSDPTAMAVGTEFLHVVSWNFVASGFVFTCSAVFQGLGNTVPSVISSATRIVSFIVPALWFSAQPSFALNDLWYISVASQVVQALVSLWLVRREFRLRLRGAPRTAPSIAEQAIG
jgi:Na+-driven multidrug efflux pump